MQRKFKLNSAFNLDEDGRFVALEGLRGIAALMVVLFHSIAFLFPFAWIGSGVIRHNRFEDNWYSFYFSGVIAGGLWVTIFFILSGFVLSIGFFREKDLKNAINKNTIQALKRYFRLMLPALASIFISYLAILAGLNYNEQAAQITGAPGWSEVWSFSPNLLSAIRQGLYGIFVGEVSYNPPLWTMQWEFLGSFLIFALLAIFGKNRSRYLVYLILFFLLLNSFLLGFVLGVILADLYNQKKLPRISNYAAIPMVLTGFFLAGFPKGDLKPWGYFNILGLSPFQWYAIGATLIILVCLLNSRVNKLFSNKISLWFGAQTFSIYLLHYTVLLTSMSFVFVKLVKIMPYTPAALLSIFSLFLILLPVSYLFTKYIDVSAIKFSRDFAKKMLRANK